MADSIKTKTTVERLRAKSTCWLTMPQQEPAPRLVVDSTDNDQPANHRSADDLLRSAGEHQNTGDSSGSATADGTVSRLNDDYEILGIAGESPVCRVYKVRNEQLGSVMALKLLKDEFAGSEAANRQFQREISAATTLCHPNIVPVYGHGRLDNGAVFVVEKLCDGARNLAQIIRADGKIEAKRGVNLFVQIADAMAHAHSKAVVHGDLKPSNIVVQPGETADEETASVIDFGIATVLQSARSAVSDVKNTGEIFGTPEYMSPEQCLGDPLDQRSDIYSFGCLMYEALTGTAPFRGINPVQIIMQHLDGPFPALDEELRKQPLAAELEMIIKKCMEKDPASRFQTFDQLKTELEKMRRGERRSQPSYYTHANIPRRVFASLLDGAIAGCLFWLINMWIAATFEPIFRDTTAIYRLMTVIESFTYGWPAVISSRACQPSNTNTFFDPVYTMAFLLLYFFIFECSVGATPGKILLGLRVQTRTGQRISPRGFIKRMLVKPVTLQSMLLSSFIFSGRNSLLDKVAFPPTDEFSQTYVMRKCKTPDQMRTNRYITASDTNLAQAHKFRKRALAVLAVQAAMMTLSHGFAHFSECYGWLLWMAPSAIIALTFHARCKQLSRTTASSPSTSWTTLFMRSLQRGKGQG